MTSMFIGIDLHGNRVRNYKILIHFAGLQQYWKVIKQIMPNCLGFVFIRFLLDEQIRQTLCVQAQLSTCTEQALVIFQTEIHKEQADVFNQSENINQYCFCYRYRKYDLGKDFGAKYQHLRFIHKLIANNDDIINGPFNRKTGSTPYKTILGYKSKNQRNKEKL